MLSREDVAFYREQGYLIVPSVLSPEELARLRAAVDRIVVGASRVSRNDDVYDLEDTHTAERPRVRRIKAPHKVDPLFYELLRADKLLEPMKALLGPAVRFQNSKLNMKSAGFGAAVEWHQDWAYYPYTNDDVLALGVLLDDFAEDNGAMMVIPGSHKGPIYDHHVDGVFCGGMDPTRVDVDFAKAVPLYAPAGSMTLHHARTIHGSALNRSGRSRNFLLYETCAGDAWPLAGGFAPFSDLAEFNARLLCGEPTIQPRLAPVPVRMPQPKPIDASSLYQQQKALGHRFFETYAEEKAPA
jgi:ectoine hydroxylase-related dioxygenase (phytanoyl-CoA dioxygenase family)